MSKHTPEILFYTDDLIASVLMQSKGVTHAQAMKAARTMSKQHRRQAWLKWKGLCIVCGKTLGRRKDRCDDCAVKHNKRQLDRYRARAILAKGATP